MADRDTMVFLATIAGTREDFEKLAEVLVSILKEQSGETRPSAASVSWSVVPSVGISI